MSICSDVAGGKALMAQLVSWSERLKRLSSGWLKVVNEPVAVSTQLAGTYGIHLFSE